MNNEHSTPAVDEIRAAMEAAAARTLAAITPERRAVCLIRAARVFQTADQFPLGLFISTADKAGFVVWSCIGTPFKTAAVDRFIAGVVAEAQEQLRAAAAEKQAA